MKFCTLCGRELPLSQFPTNRGMADGHLGKCFECWELFTSGRKRVVEIAKRKEVKTKPTPTKRRLRPAPICVYREGWVGYDINGVPINPGKSNKEAYKAYRAAYMRWYHRKRKELDPDYVKERSAKSLAYKKRRAAEGVTYKCDWKKYYRAYRERYPERYAAYNERAKQRYWAKKAEKSAKTIAK